MPPTTRSIAHKAGPGLLEYWGRISDLPPELRAQVLADIAPRDLRSCKLVCKAWRSHLSQRAVWLQLAGAEIAARATCRGYRPADLKGLHQKLAGIQRALPQLGRLHLVVGEQQFGKAVVFDLTDCPRGGTVEHGDGSRLPPVTFSFEGIARRLALGFPGLKHLSLDAPHGDFLVRPASLAPLLTSLRGLVTLDLSACRYDARADLTGLTNLSALEDLRLGQMPHYRSMGRLGWQVQLAMPGQHLRALSTLARLTALTLDICPRRESGQLQGIACITGLTRLVLRVLKVRWAGRVDPEGGWHRMLSASRPSHPRTHSWGMLPVLSAPGWPWQPSTPRTTYRLCISQTRPPPRSPRSPR